LTWNTGGPAYQARVRVWDSTNMVSGWADQTVCIGSGCQGGGTKWKTPNHAYPNVNFTFVPNSPGINQNTLFTDQTTFYDVGPRVWSWNFGDGSPTTGAQNPTHMYLDSGLFTVTNTVTDLEGYTCALSKPLTVQGKVPTWREVAPR
ncbi:MAG: PKD domain-containing protein, partial [bacterium]|nr:PKD domain-containing protein [bacterium]